jgi:hypothetical protein
MSNNEQIFKPVKNKITTLSYFVKRLKDCQFNTWKICSNYALADPRKWTIMVDPGNTSLFITCYENKDFKGEMMFEFNDGGRSFPRNYSLKTSSMEVIVTTLIERGVSQIDETELVETTSI